MLIVALNFMFKISAPDNAHKKLREYCSKVKQKSLTYKSGYRQQKNQKFHQQGR